MKLGIDTMTLEADPLLYLFTSSYQLFQHDGRENS